MGLDEQRTNELIALSGKVGNGERLHRLFSELDAANDADAGVIVGVNQVLRAQVTRP